MSVDIYFISDHTGLTIESVGQTLLSQFDLKGAKTHTRPYIDTREKARALIEEVRSHAGKVVIFSSFVNTELQKLLDLPTIEHIDLFSTFIPRLEKALGQRASGKRGLTNSAHNYHKYMLRIEALNYALGHDDGLGAKHYVDAEVILVGVSRSGKTPTSLYLAIQFGIKAANYPLTEDELIKPVLPASLIPYREKLFGLLIDATRLHEIRSERLSNSRYASLAQCQHELQTIKAIYRNEQIPFLDTTNLSVEEISTQILLMTGLKKHF